MSASKTSEGMKLSSFYDNLSTEILEMHAFF